MVAQIYIQWIHEHNTINSKTVQCLTWNGVNLVHSWNMLHLSILNKQTLQKQLKTSSMRQSVTNNFPEKHIYNASNSHSQQELMLTMIMACTVNIMSQNQRKWGRVRRVSLLNEHHSCYMLPPALTVSRRSVVSTLCQRNCKQ